VIAGIVFEDTIRRICRVQEIPENGVALDTLISELTKQERSDRAKRKARPICRRTADLSRSRPVGGDPVQRREAGN